MEIKVDLPNNLLPDKYGKYANPQAIKNGKPVISFPIKLSDIPADAKTIALTFTDPDSIPVCGFEWIHWTAANIPVAQEITEDFSQTATAPVVQGKNSSASPLLDGPKDVATGYNGPYPPDQTHDYVLKVFALDDNLDLENGFWMNELLHKMDGHIVASAQQTIPSRA
ncbi:YbhB/YbcL family Raf kinase inhibitor-like protein [Companilactobacillus farciminis]|jgi:Raf kinase inhibitor-like YbhB/YbcL family protein|uniref:YbhB/YbcL family Raf kinase inhibitor-like protein n=1 Tax=Companilactobacillus farciminis TaxID=1612 RepID=UPI00232EC60A|nr:YbhB/YbcL family Raf kinase inhibitor-like protein [Companilactobacillus farciminis]WCG35214.1 YbhB/YbcL family Raf kinase inhibitor-like protein [Companilactobacillus farciminis]